MKRPERPSSNPAGSSAIGRGDRLRLQIFERRSGSGNITAAGSTTYGVGVPWWDTIPSKFVEEAKQSGVCVTAINYGVPYHFSRQEAVYFATRLMDEPAPDAVVFLDGLNEFFQPGSSIRAEPFFTPTLDQLVPIGPDPSRNTSLDAPAPGLWSRVRFLLPQSPYSEAAWTVSGRDDRRLPCGDLQQQESAAVERAVE